MSAETMHSTTGQNIKKFRERIGFSQDSIADYLGIKRELISYYENGKREIPIQHLNKLTDLFGIELIDLLEEVAIAQQANFAFAFRADSIQSNDFEAIASFKKIVKNYVKMKSLLHTKDDRDGR